ncbi:hypothetical protein B0H13DRAFT_1579436, partial [Mycena leptocephala]
LISADQEQPVGKDLCGFCGLDGCFTQLLMPKNKAVSVNSSCRYHYSGMNYKSAQVTAARSPCTNVPIHCPFCPVDRVSCQPETIWKYRTMPHIAVAH